MRRKIKNPPAGYWDEARANRARPIDGGFEVGVLTRTGWHTIYVTAEFLRELLES